LQITAQHRAQRTSAGIRQHFRDSGPNPAKSTRGRRRIRCLVLFSVTASGCSAGSPVLAVGPQNSYTERENPKMNKQNENQFVYKESNIMRSMGLLFLVLSPLFFLLSAHDTFSYGGIVLEKFGAWIFVTISIIMILFSSNLTITADKSIRMLHVRYSFVLFHRTRDIPFDDIADIQSQAGVNSRKASTRGYRLVAVMKDGTIFPFRNYFNRHDNKKQAAVNLRFAVTGSRHSDVPPVKSAGASLTI
jgi:hypothetical protein